MKELTAVTTGNTGAVSSIVGRFTRGVIMMKGMSVAQVGQETDILKITSGLLLL